MAALSEGTATGAATDAALSNPAQQCIVCGVAYSSKFLLHDVEKELTDYSCICAFCFHDMPECRTCHIRTAYLYGLKRYYCPDAELEKSDVKNQVKNRCVELGRITNLGHYGDVEELTVAPSCPWCKTDVRCFTLDCYNSSSLTVRRKNKNGSIYAIEHYCEDCFTCKQCNYLFEENSQGFCQNKECFVKCSVCRDGVSTSEVHSRYVKGYVCEECLPATRYCKICGERLCSVYGCSNCD